MQWPDTSFDAYVRPSPDGDMPLNSKGWTLDLLPHKCPKTRRQKKRRGNTPLPHPSPTIATSNRSAVYFYLILSSCSVKVITFTWCLLRLFDYYDKNVYVVKSVNNRGVWSLSCFHLKLILNSKCFVQNI